MADISLEQWIRIKNQGKIKYLLIHWVLLAAVPVAVIMPVVSGLARGESLSYFLSDRFVGSFLLFLLLCIVISLLAGNSKWKKLERLHNTKA